jgi:hypothetical protein
MTAPLDLAKTIEECVAMYGRCYALTGGRFQVDGFTAVAPGMDKPLYEALRWRVVIDGDEYVSC